MVGGWWASSLRGSPPCRSVPTSWLAPVCRVEHLPCRLRWAGAMLVRPPSRFLQDSLPTLALPPLCCCSLSLLLLLLSAAAAAAALPLWLNTCTRVITHSWGKKRGQFGW